MKEIQDRLDFWNEQFNTLDRITPNDLLMRFERKFQKKISHSTLQGDLKKLRTMIEPQVLHNERFENRNDTLNRNQKSHYFYSETFVPYAKTEFTGEDAKRIQEVVSILNQFQYLPQLNDLKIVLSKIEQQLNPSDASSCEISYIIAFDQVPKLHGIHRLAYLYNAIISKNVQFMYYKPFNKPLEMVTLHPYFLKQFRNRWFVYGLNTDAHKVFPYALDRIQRMEKSPLSFTPNTYIHFETHFTDLIGITHSEGDKPYPVRLKVKKPRAFYMDTKPWHPSQVREKEEDTYIIFQFYLVLNKELEAQILEFGKDVEVLEPLSLRQNIYNILQEAIRYYQ